MASSSAAPALPSAQALPPPFYANALGAVRAYPPLDGSRRADVCVIGGGFTGLSAALHLAEAGADVVLLEAGRIGMGASGRSGGQIHSGQRRDVLWLEKRFGHQRARRLWDAAEDAKALLRSLIGRFAIACDLRAGVIEALHKRSLVPEAAELVEALASRFGYERMSLLDAAATEAALGSARFVGAVRDAGGGHLDPLRLALGLARGALSLGAALHEQSPALAFRRAGRQVVVHTERGEVRADHAVVATDGRSGALEQKTRRRIVGVNSFMIATEPLGSAGERILPGGESAADSRFVVRYWRKSADGRLIFGGGESNAGQIPADIAATVRPHVADIYPALADVPVAQAWGGIVSVTMPRLPFVREIEPGVWAAGGYSGQGVALAPYVGKLLAEAALGRPEALADFTSIPMPPLPLNTAVRRALVSLELLRGRLSDRL